MRFSFQLKTGFLQSVAGVLCLAISCFPLPSSAQQYGNTAQQQRLERLERDLQILQRQFYRERGGTPPSGAPAAPDTGSVSAARLDSQLARIDEQWRQLIGRLETLEHRQQQLEDQLTRFQQDIEYRLGNQSGNASTTSGTMSSGMQIQLVPQEDAATPPGSPEPAPIAATAAGSETSPVVPQIAIAEQKTPHDTYNHAFKLLNMTRYDEARQVFEQFIKNYPKDALIGNAYYWIGETYYVERDFVTSADYFRQGYEAMPDGPKAPDNLLKLAMALDASNMREEACVVLGQVQKKYSDAGPGIAQKTKIERARLGCK